MSSLNAWKMQKNNARLKLLEDAVKQNTALTISVEKLANSMENMANEQMKQGERLEALEGRDGEKWRNVASTVLSTIIGIIVGVVATQLGLQ